MAHDIMDNRRKKLVGHINRILSSTERARFAAEAEEHPKRAETKRLAARREPGKFAIRVGIGADCGPEKHTPWFARRPMRFPGGEEGTLGGRGSETPLGAACLRRVRGGHTR